MCFIWFAHCSQIVLEEKHLTILPIRQYSKSSKGEGEYNILNCISNRESLSQISIWHSIIQNLTLKVNWKQTDSQHPCWSALGYCSEARITWTYMFFCNSAYTYSVQAWDLETRISSHHRLTKCCYFGKVTLLSLPFLTIFLMLNSNILI